ncbi:hypothetical protein [Amycolatopsis granulosa]|uniref:hypothetical protein n=1 Tax=Amycolatopsis granulosa TaxID=185684 RepID=UPI00141EAE68|nr:hypothetical protein [Amycolatopsis granulosa]NIH86555.1 hypothetical protein [Amycolatopsis granulosa]
MNIVIFQVKGREDDLARGVAPAKDEDAVRQAWRQVQAERNIQATDVTRVHCLWQPSRVDRVFLAGMFGRVERTHQFDRPEGDDWSAALAHAGEVMARAAEEAARERAEETVADDGEDGEWLPVLHTHDSPLEHYASVPVVAGRLYLGFARTTVTSAGRVGMLHLMRNTVEAMSEDEYLALAGEAMTNLKRGLVLRTYTDAEKGTLLTLGRGDDNLCAGSAIVLDDFHENAAGKVGEDTVVVGLISPDHIVVAGASSAWAGEIEEWVRTSPDASGDLVPCALRLDGSPDIEIITERPSGRLPADVTA